MADILAGNSGLNADAPLTKAQTVAMCQHLAAEIRSVESMLGEVQRDLHHTQEHLQSVRDKSAQTYEDVHSLQVGLTDTNINLDKVAKELGRVGQATQQLQVDDQQAQEKIMILEESRKMFDTKMEAMLIDIAAAKASDVMLKEAVERQINEDLRTLRKEVASTNLSVNQVTSEQKQTAAYCRENRDAVRDARVDMERVLNEVKKANTVTNILENRLATTAKGLNQSWGKCAELSDAMVKLTECYDKTKARVQDVEGVVKEVTSYGHKTRGDLESAVRVVEHNTDRLEKALKLIDEEVSATEAARHELNALRQSQATTTRQITTLKSEVNEVKQQAVRNMGAIKETSSMLLPNIHVDSDQAKSISKRHGSLLHSSAITDSGSPGRPNSRKTPRGP